MNNHPTIGLVDVYAATLPTLRFSAGVHINYAETVLPMRDGLPKLKDFPKEFGGSGEVVPTADMTDCGPRGRRCCPMARSVVHPGKVLADELEALGVKPTELSRQIAVPPNRVSQIINGKRGITGDRSLGPAIMKLLRHHQ
jgi:hypothetical protein